MDIQRVACFVFLLKTFKLVDHFKFFNLSLSETYIPENIGEKGRKRKFTVVCLVPWLLNRSEAGTELVLLQTSLFFTL